MKKIKNVAFVCCILVFSATGNSFDCSSFWIGTCLGLGPSCGASYAANLVQASELDKPLWLKAYQTTLRKFSLDHETYRRYVVAFETILYRGTGTIEQDSHPRVLLDSKQYAQDLFLKGTPTSWDGRPGTTILEGVTTAYYPKTKTLVFGLNDYCYKKYLADDIATTLLWLAAREQKSMPNCIAAKFSCLDCFICDSADTLEEDFRDKIADIFQKHAGKFQYENDKLLLEIWLHENLVEAYHSIKQGPLMKPICDLDDEHIQ